MKSKIQGLIYQPILFSTGTIHLHSNRMNQPGIKFGRITIFINFNVSFLFLLMETSLEENPFLKPINLNQMEVTNNQFYHHKTRDLRESRRMSYIFLKEVYIALLAFWEYQKLEYLIQYLEHFEFSPCSRSSEPGSTIRRAPMHQCWMEEQMDVRRELTTRDHHQYTTMLFH